MLFLLNYIVNWEDTTHTKDGIQLEKSKDSPHQIKLYFDLVIASIWHRL